MARKLKLSPGRTGPEPPGARTADLGGERVVPLPRRRRCVVRRATARAPRRFRESLARRDGRPQVQPHSRAIDPKARRPRRERPSASETLGYTDERTATGPTFDGGREEAAGGESRPRLATRLHQQAARGQPGRHW